MSEECPNIALRECRAELALQQSQRAALARRVLELESIKPLLDGLALQQAESERDAARAEREREETAHNATYTKLVEVADKLAAERAALAALQAKVARAVAELETVSACMPGGVVDAALEALKECPSEQCDPYRADHD